MTFSYPHNDGIDLRVPVFIKDIPGVYNHSTTNMFISQNKKLLEGTNIRAWEIHNAIFTCNMTTLSHCILYGTVYLRVMHSSHVPRGFERARPANLEQLKKWHIRWGQDANLQLQCPPTVVLFCLLPLYEDQHKLHSAVQPTVHNPGPSRKSNFEYLAGQNGLLEHRVPESNAPKIKSHGFMSQKDSQWSDLKYLLDVTKGVGGSWTTQNPSYNCNRGKCPSLNPDGDENIGLKIDKRKNGRKFVPTLKV